MSGAQFAFVSFTARAHAPMGRACGGANEIKVATTWLLFTVDRCWTGQSGSTSSIVSVKQALI